MKPSIYISIFFWAASLITCKQESSEIQDPPEIENFTMPEDTIGAVVTISGKNFSENIANNTVIFNSVQTNPFYATRDTLKVKVPQGAATDRIQVKVHNMLCASTDTFFVLTGKWTKMADCPGSGRFDGVGFSVANIGYVSNGTGYGKYLNDTWAFNPFQNSWKQVADFPGGRRREAVSFSIGNKAYVGFGTNTDIFTGTSDFYEFDPPTGLWTKKADIPSGSCNNAVGLALDGKGYIITGHFSKQVLEYNPATNQWLRKGEFPGEARTAAAGFVIKDKGYIAGGTNGYGPSLVDLWEYDGILDKWSRRADMPSIVGYEGTGFSISGKGYICNANNAYKELWEYDPSKNKWVKKKHFPGNGLRSCVSFIIDNTAYIATGVTLDNVSNDIWKFEPK